MDAIIECRDNLFKKHELKRYNTWRVGGTADLFYQPKSIEELSETLRECHVKTPILWLGLGSNILFRDAGFRGLVIATQKHLDQVKQVDHNTIRAEAGLTSAKFAKFCANLGLAESEFFSGIPGTVGGALAMNAGAFGGETWRYVVGIETIDRQGNIHHRTPDEFEVNYREVNGKPDEWFVAGYFKFPQGNSERQRQAIKSILKKRSDSQPIGQLNCGSVFRNPPNNFAAKLIEETGLKSFRIGGAYVSEKHANFIINDGSATASDIEQLIETVRNRVNQEKGIQLKHEVHMYGEY